MNLSPRTKSRLLEVSLALLALLLIGGALAVTFSEVFRAEPGEISGRYDIFRYYAPITFYLDYCISQGELPLWNPLVYCGLPNAANPQAFVFYPLNLLRSLALPSVSPQTTNTSLVVFIGLHLLFMGFCTYLFARAHRLSFPAALVAALAWVCSALIVRRACEYHFLYTLAWLPLILILVKAAIDSPAARRRLIYCIAAGIFLGIGILGGFLQIISYMGVCIGVYALLYRMLLSRVVMPSGRFSRARSLFGEVLSFGAIFLFAGLIAMVLLLPVAELTGFSARQKGMPVPMYSDMMAWDVERLYQSIVVFAGMKYEAETLRGAGIVTLLLALAGCFHRNRRLVLLFVLLAYALIDCGFGPPFPLASLLHVLTPFSPSAYSRGFDFALLPLGLLAGLGVDALWHGRAWRPRRGLMTLVLAYGAAATVGPLVYWIGQDDYYLPVTWEVIALPLIALVAALAIAWSPRYWRRTGAVLLLIFPALLFAETWSWNRHYVPWMIAAENNLRGLAPVEASEGGFPTTNSRTTDPVANRALYTLTPVMNGVDPLHFAAVRDFLSGRPRDKRSHRLVTEWEPTAENHRGNLLLKRFFWLSRYVVEGPLPGKGALFSPTTTAYVSDGTTIEFPAPPPGRAPYESISREAVRVEIPGIEPVLDRQQAGNERMMRFDIALPDTVAGVRAGSSGALHSTLIFEYTSAVTAEIDTRFRDPESGERLWGKRHRVGVSRNTARTLEVPIPDLSRASVEVSIEVKGNGAVAIRDAYVMVDPSDEDALIQIASFTSNEVVLQVGPLPGPRLLTFLDAWYPGWKAYVDGREVFVLAAADVFKAIPVPEGTHEVRFAFRPRSVYLGMSGSIAAFLLALGLIVWLGLAGVRAR